MMPKWVGVKKENLVQRKNDQENLVQRKNGQENLVQRKNGQENLVQEAQDIEGINIIIKYYIN